MPKGGKKPDVENKTSKSTSDNVDTEEMEVVGFIQPINNDNLYQFSNENRLLDIHSKISGVKFVQQFVQNQIESDNKRNQITLGNIHLNCNMSADTLSRKRIGSNSKATVKDHSSHLEPPSFRINKSETTYTNPSSNNKSAPVNTEMKYADLNKELSEVKANPLVQHTKNPETTETEKESDINSNKSHIYWICCIIIVLLGILWFMINNRNDTSPEELTTYFPHKLYSQKFTELSNEFSQQPALTYRTINLTIYDTLDTSEPESPGVILLLGTEGNYDITERVEIRLSELLKETFNENMHYFNCRQLANVNLQEAKRLLSHNITNVFNKKKTSFLILEEVDFLPSDIVSILQPFFDHENAPYKRVIFLLTAVTEERLTSNAIKATRALAINHFDKKWADYPNEHRYAMYSRMLNSVAVLVPEEIHK